MKTLLFVILFIAFALGNAYSTTSVAPSAVDPTVTTISSNNYLSNLGSNVVFTAIVKSNSYDYYSTNYFDGGTVTFMEGAVVLAADVPLVLSGTYSSTAGTASFATSSLTEGKHFITVIYNGHPTFATSSALVVQTVINPASCATFTNNIAYVNAAVAGGDNSGTSWVNAFLTLEEALDAARTCGVKQIWVAKGTYLPTDYPIGISTSGTLSDRNYAFEMVDGVAVYGGFSGNGTETNINQRNFTSNQTILNGNNHFYNIVISLNDGNTTKLDGFTITGGNADATTNFTFEDVLYYLSARNGAGLNAYNSSIEVDNCLFYGNNATGTGGAISLYKGSPSFNNIIVKNNTAFTGGGLASASGSTIRNAVFSENIAGAGGGLYIAGIYYRSGEVNSLINVVISKNQATRANTSQLGGGILNNSSTVNYVNCTFYGNHAGSGTGGAQYNVNGCIITDKNSIYYGNSADGGYPDIRNYTPGGDLYTTTTVLFGNPLFVNEADPDGPDNIWMSNDDGLTLQNSSSAINAGTLAGAPTTDIRGLTRTGNPDQGAYEYGALIQPTTTVVISNLNPSCFESDVTFTATVTSNGNPVTGGTVTFTEGATVLASNVSLNGSGQATFTSSLLTPGSHTILASYNGTTLFNTSSGSISQLVNAPPSVNITGPSSICLCNINPTIYTAVLDGLSESVPNASAGSGNATITIDNVAKTMRVQCTFSGLTGTVTASHIHSATAVPNSGTAGVATTTPTFPGFPSGVAAGTYDQTFDMTQASSFNAAFITANGGTTASAFAALVAGLNSNKAYYNIHSNLYPGGEIRGFLSSNCVATYLSPTTGGTWTSSNPAVAIVSNGGVVNAVSEGTVTFTFTDATTNCSATTPLVTVNRAPDAVATPSSQAICSGLAITTIVNSGSVTGTVFNWTSDIGSTSVTGIAASGTGDISGSLINPTNVPVTVTFTITPTANNCEGWPVTATVLVNPTPDAVATPSSQTICSGSDISKIVNSGNVAGTVFNWTSDIGSTSVTGIAASGTGDISGVLTNPTLTPVTVTFTITPTANGCTGTAIKATVVVNPLTSISVDPVNQTIYALTNTTFSVTVAGVLPVTYQWQESTNGGATFTDLSDGGVYSGSTTSSLSLTNVPISMNGYKYQCVVTGCSSVTSGSALLTVNKRPTTLTYNGDLAIQYSDQVHLSANLTDNVSGLGFGGATITFTIGTQSITAVTNSSGVATASLLINQAPGTSYSVNSEFTGNVNELASSDSDPFTINKEDAVVEYTGAEFASTGTAMATSAKIRLSASVKDIADGSRGDIRNAMVRFKIQPYSCSSMAPEAIVYTSWINVSLVNLADATIGTAYIDFSLDISSCNAKIYDITTEVSNYYTGNSEAFTITVAKSLDDFIAGGGHLKNGAGAANHSGGIYKSTDNSKSNWGFNAKYNKKKSNLQGGVNIIIRSGGNTYQVKGIVGGSNGSLGVDVSDPTNKRAVLTAKANMIDVATGLTVPFGSNATLELKMDDKGEPGANIDTYAITIWGSNNSLLYSSNWSGTKTNEVPINGGNIQVRSSTTAKIGEVTDPALISVVKASANLVMQVYPNPTKGQFTLSLQLPEIIDAKAKIQLVNMMGKAVYTEDAEMGNGVLQKTITTPSSFANGLYIVRVIIDEKLYKTQLIFAR